MLISALGWPAQAQTHVPEWRFCTVGSIGSDHIFLSQPFQDGRRSEALENLVSAAVVSIGVIHEAVQCRQPTTLADAVAARAHAADLNHQVGTKVIDIELQVHAPTTSAGAQASE